MFCGKQGIIFNVFSRFCLLILFQNSPLYQYLQDLGHTDFEVCSSVSQKAEQCAAAESEKERTLHAAQKVSTPSSWVFIFSKENNVASQIAKSEDKDKTVTVF